MRTTFTIDDELFSKATALAEPGIEKSELLRECVKAFIQRQSARRLAALGGQVPEIQLAPPEAVRSVRQLVSVLVDTSVWVEHFKHRNELLVRLLEDGRVLCHPHVIVEVACGTPPQRRFIIHLLAELESVPVATHEELLTLIERRPLWGRGCGFVDVSLIASALLGDSILIWTLDKRLDAIAAEAGRSYRQLGR